MGEVPDRLWEVADRLRAAGIDRPVFVGGSIVGIHLTDPASPPPRPTFDVDVVIDVPGRAAFYRTEERLRSHGHHQHMQGPICRWSFGTLIVDIMPADTSILSFGNRWYPSLIENALPIASRHGTIWIASPPYLVATKLDAFDGRGAGDYTSSADLEDILVLIDGRRELASDIDAAPPDVASFVRDGFARLVHTPAFVDSIDMHLLPDEASQARASVILGRMEAIGRA